MDSRTKIVDCFREDQIIWSFQLSCDHAVDDPRLPPTDLDFIHMARQQLVLTGITAAEMNEISFAVKKA